MVVGTFACLLASRVLCWISLALEPTGQCLFWTRAAVALVRVRWRLRSSRVRLSVSGFFRFESRDRATKPVVPYNLLPVGALDADGPP